MEPVTDSISFAQPNGLNLRLTFERPHSLIAELLGAGMHAKSVRWWGATELADFFRHSAARESPEQRFEYKADEAIILQASRPTYAPDHVELRVILLAGGTDDSDWEVNGTILLPQDQYAIVAKNAQLGVARELSPVIQPPHIERRENLLKSRRLALSS